MLLQSTISRGTLLVWSLLVASRLPFMDSAGHGLAVCPYLNCWEDCTWSPPSSKTSCRAASSRSRRCSRWPWEVPRLGELLTPRLLLPTKCRARRLEPPPMWEMCTFDPLATPAMTTRTRRVTRELRVSPGPQAYKQIFENPKTKN